MITEALAAVAGLFKVIGGFIGIGSQKITLNNTPQMQQNVEEQREQQEKAKDVQAIQEAITTNNLSDLRKRVS